MKSKVLTPKATANIKHSPTSSKINIEPCNKTYLSQFLLPGKSCLAFIKKKKKKKILRQEKRINFKEAKQELKLDSDIADFWFCANQNAQWNLKFK